MKITTIKLTKFCSTPLLTASEGMMLTNGETYSKEVYLGINDSVDNWHEITEEEYEKVMKEQMPEAEE